MRDGQQRIAARSGVMLTSALDRYFSDDSTGGTIAALAPTDSYPGFPSVLSLLTETPSGKLFASATSGMIFVVRKDTSGGLNYSQTAGSADLAPAVIVSPASVVDRARSVFGLNISETAEVFRVSRPTIYQWMKLQDSAQVRSRADRERIKAIYQAAQLWKARAPLKGRWPQTILPSGTTVLDILKAPKIDPDALMDAHTALEIGTEARRKEDGARARQAISALARAFSQLASEKKARKGRS